MELIIIGLVTAANFLILIIKAEQHRWADLIFAPRPTKVLKCP